MLQLQTACGYLAFFADWSPDRIAFVNEGDEITYRDAATTVGAYASLLQQRGVDRGDVVAVYGHSQADCFMLFLACMKVHAVFTGLNPKYSRRELEFFIRDADPTMMVVCAAGQDLTKLEEAEGAAGFSGSTLAQGDLLEWAAEHREPLSPASTTGPRQSTAATPAGDDAALRAPAVIVYTSGTTGTPKAAVLSEPALCLSAELTAQTWYGGIVPKTVSDKPINHLGWLVCVCLSALVRGGTLYFEPRFDPARVLELIASSRMNSWLTSSVLLGRVAALPGFETADLSSLEMLGISAPTPAEVIEPFARRSGARVANSYGLTEASGGVVTASRAGTTLAEALTTVGAPVPGIEFMIADQEGRPVGAGERGEVNVRGPLVFLGYQGNEAATSDAIRPDGWLRTGDMAVQRDDGNIELVGRIKEMYKSGGINVYPVEVESILVEHPSVAQAAVVGVPDPEWGEIGVALVVPTVGRTLPEGELKAFCRARLANHKIPKRFVLLRELPRLASGKVDRRRLQSAVASGSLRAGETYED
jgi:acyl-CoA synthetase (AMP-forming)/AMP-acid ligase II